MEGHTSRGMSDSVIAIADSVIAIAKIVSADAHRMMMGVQLIAKHHLHQNSIDTITAFLCKTLNGNLVLFLCGGKHPMGKDSHIVIVKIAFQKTNSMHLVDIVVALRFSRSTVRLMVHLDRGMPFFPQAVNLAACKANRSLLKLAAL